MKVEGYSLEMPRYVTHKVEVYLYDDGYEATLRFGINGNTKGSSILQHAIGLVEEWDFQKRHVVKGKVSVDEDSYVDVLYLVNEKGDTLQLSRHEFEDDLSQMIIGTKIVEWDPEKN